MTRNKASMGGRFFNFKVERMGLSARTLFWVLVILILLHNVQTRPLAPYGKDTHAVKLWVSIGSSYRPHLKVYELFQRLIASTEEQLRVFALEIEGNDGGEEGVSIKQEYQRSQETSTSRCQEEHMLHFRVNKGVSDRNEGGGEEGEGRNGGRGNGSGRRGGGGGGGDGGGGGGGGGGDGEKDDMESKGGDKKKLSPTLEISLPMAMSTLSGTTQIFGSVISLKVGALTSLAKLLLILVMANSLVGYLCSFFAIYLMLDKPRVSRVLVWTGFATTILGYLVLIVVFIIEL